MNPKVNYIVVGTFVISLLIATIIFALWLAFGYGESLQETYLIYMDESVAGLSKDAPVKFNGVNVGSIQNIAIAENPAEVVIKIKVDDNTPVNVDTRATLMSQGLTGLSYIDLSGGNLRSPPLKPKPGETYAIIPTNPSLMVRLDTLVEKLSSSINQMSHSVDFLLRDENQKSITEILHHVAKVTKAVADHSNELGQTIQILPKTLLSVNQTFDTINTQTLPSLNLSLLMLTNTLPNFSNFVQELAQNPSVLWRGTMSDQLGPGEKN